MMHCTLIAVAKGSLPWTRNRVQTEPRALARDSPCHLRVLASANQQLQLCPLNAICLAAGSSSEDEPNCCSPHIWRCSNNAPCTTGITRRRWQRLRGTSAQVACLNCNHPRMVRQHAKLCDATFVCALLARAGARFAACSWCTADVQSTESAARPVPLACLHVPRILHRAALGLTQSAAANSLPHVIAALPRQPTQRRESWRREACPQAAACQAHG